MLSDNLVLTGMTIGDDSYYTGGKGGKNRLKPTVEIRTVIVPLNYLTWKKVHCQTRDRALVSCMSVAMCVG